MPEQIKPYFELPQFSAILEGEVVVFNPVYEPYALRAAEAVVGEKGLRWKLLDDQSPEARAAMNAHEQMTPNFEPSVLLSRRTVMGWATTLAARNAAAGVAHPAVAAVDAVIRLAHAPLEEAVQQAQSQNLIPQSPNAATIERMLALADRHDLPVSVIRTLEDFKQGKNPAGRMFTIGEQLASIEGQWPDLAEPKRFLVATRELDSHSARGIFKTFDDFEAAAQFLHEAKAQLEVEGRANDELRIYDGNAIVARALSEMRWCATDELKARFDAVTSAFGEPDVDEDLRQYSISVTYEKWDHEAREIGEAMEHGIEYDQYSADIDEVRKLVRKLGLDSTSVSRSDSGISFYAQSTSPEENSAHFEQGIDTYYTLHLHAIDGQPLTVSDVEDFAQSTGLPIDTQHLAPPAPKPPRMG